MGSGKGIEATETLQIFEVPCPECGGGSFNIILKPGILHRLICPLCKTVFYVKIRKDLGIVVLRPDEYKKAQCSECNGTGICKKCNGTGQTKCPHCDGRGWIYDIEYGFYRSCVHCGGNGYLNSYRLNFFTAVGKGDAVLGSGWGKCTACMGNGVCPRCGGEGLILG